MGSKLDFQVVNLLFATVNFEPCMMFSHIKNLQNLCKRLCNSQSSWRDVLTCNGGNCKHLKDTLAVLLFHVC